MRNLSILACHSADTVSLAKARNKTRVDFILDKIGNLPVKIPDFEALVSAARSRNIRFHFVVQSVDQLTNVYGEELKNVILDNCDTWVFMGSRGLSFLRQISELAGTVRLESGDERPHLSVDKLQHSRRVRPRRRLSSSRRASEPSWPRSRT